MSQHRKENLLEISNHTRNNRGIDDPIVRGDFNKDIQLIEMQSFFTKLGLQDTHSKCNHIITK